VTLQGSNGLVVARKLAALAPCTRTLLLAAWGCERDAVAGFRAGARGFAVKTAPGEQLLSAIRRVAAGELYLAGEVRGLDIRRLDGGARGPAPRGPRISLLGALSARERQVLALVLEGLRNEDVARRLGISSKTVDTHRTRVTHKLHCNGAVELLRFAAENRLVPRSARAPARSARGLGQAGQAHDQVRAALGLALGGQRASVGADDLLGQEQAQPQPRGGPARAEAIEQTRQQLRRDARALVEHVEAAPPPLPVRALRGDPHRDGGVRR
jgi:DNA-binding NarL/FixJ family response regulator